MVEQVIKEGEGKGVSSLRCSHSRVEHGIGESIGSKKSSGHERGGRRGSLRGFRVLGRRWMI